MRKNTTPKTEPVLLAGGNPQIAKADGDAAVESYMAAVPGWRQNVVRRVDGLIVRAVPDVGKAVRWNSPVYGIKGRGWFVGMHVFAKCVKVTFFKGVSLSPPPPGGQAKEARWIDVHEADLDEGRMVEWLKQASAIQGWGKH